MRHFLTSSWTLALAVGIVFGQAAEAAATARLAGTELAQARAAAIGEVVRFGQLPVGTTRNAGVPMRRIEVYAPDARIWLVDAEGQQTELPRSDRINFVADRSSDPNAPRIGLSIAPDGSAVDGMVLADDGRLYAVSGKPFAGELELTLLDARKDARGAGADFICDNTLDRRMEQFMPNLTGIDAPVQLLDGPGINAASRSATVAIDTDTEFLSIKFGGNQTNATNYLAALFTGMNVIYERDIDVTLLQGTTFLRTTDSYSATSTSAQLTEVGNFWVANHAAVNRAFVTFLSGKSSNPNSSAGIAWIGGDANLCNDKASNGGHYNVSQVFLFNGATAASDLLVVPHEIGHNFGANHTHCSDSTTGNGPTGSNTIDRCFSGESVGSTACFSGTRVCPAPSTVNGVTNVTGTLMSYCHLSGLSGCNSSQVFANAHRTRLDNVADSNFANGCFAPVAAGNQPPTLAAINNPAAILEDAGAQTVQLSGIGDGDSAVQQNLTITATSSNTGVIPNPTVNYVNPNTTGSLSYTPVANASGAATITVTVQDNGGGTNTVTRTFTVSVTAVNDAPTLSPVSNPAAILEDAGQQTINLAGIADGDAEATQTLSVSASSDNSALIPTPTLTYTSPNATGTLRYTPVANAAGTAVITVTVTDNGGTANGGVNSVSRQFTVTVTAVNDEPTLNAITNPAAINEDAGQQSISLSGIGMGTGDSGQVLTVSASSSNTGLIPNPSISYTSPNATGILSYTPVANASGTATITVTVTDNGGTANGGDNALSRQFTVNVIAVNDAPTLDPIPNPAALPEDAAPQQLTLSGIGPGPGDPAQQLTVTASSSNTTLLPHPTVNYTSPGTLATLSFAPNDDQSGLATVTVTVSDNGGTANGGSNVFTRQFTVNVFAVNDEPTLNAIPTPTILPIGSGPRTIQLSGIGPGAGDPAQTLTVTATSNNPGLIPNPTVSYTSPGATGSISYAPVAGQQGAAVISVTVTDNGGTGNGGDNSITRTFEQVIAGGGEPPLFVDGFE